ncbi:MAG: M48 family metalloprotease [Spirochaetota bacterium]
MRFLLRQLLFLFLIASTCSCEKAVNLVFSDADDVEIGKSMDTQIRNSKEYKVLRNTPLRNYVQKVANEVLRSKFVRKKNIYPYKVTLIEDDSTINAFCTPGGFIYVYTGLLRILPNEASLAAVLAHEIAHAEKRHARQRMLAAFGVELIISLILGEGSSILVEIGSKLAGNLALLSNSRGDELESDEMGFLYLQGSIYYPGAMSYFFDEIQKSRKDNRIVKMLSGFLSTHPLPEKRLRKNYERIQKAEIPKAKASNLFTRRYKRTLRKYGVLY